MRNKINTFLPIVLWIAVVAYSLVWNIQTVEENTTRTVYSIGRSFFSEIETTRLWNARHGGVYVPITEETQPNPYLEDPERDVTTLGGVKLTKVNPAFMTRQIAEIAKEQNDIQYHITSLKPIRPANAADKWETKALEGFEAGAKELLELIQEDMAYRYMAPLMVKEACLPCHTAQGYQLGDIRGGISVTIPAATYINAAQTAKNNLIIIHAIALIAGIGVFYVFQSFRDKQMNLLNQKNLTLEYEIEERKKVELSLVEARITAESANRAKSEFLSNMSHELRTPLNAILGFTQLLYPDQNLNAQQRENLAIVHRSGEHLLNLINTVLDMSKIEAGRLTVNEQDFDLYRLLNDVEDMCRLRAEDKRLHLLFERAPNVPQYIHADELRLRQVLINLLNNAVKFTTEGGISVRVGVGDGQESSETATINLIFEVEDTGPGILPDELNTLFDAFVQTTTGKVSQEGTGLGLAISRKFAQLMGGEMSVSSRLGTGTVFKFSIKTSVVDMANVQTAQVARRVIALSPGQPRYRILIVDDREINRRLLVQILSPLGFELQEAENGRQAIKIWAEWAPHLIWMDIRMPVMDGYEATKQIKATTKGQATIVIALTASSFEEEKAIVLSTGCDGFLRKPFKDLEIFNLMQKHLGVQYVYVEEEEKPEDKEVVPEILTPAALTALPADLLSDLEQAVIRINLDLIANALEKIHSYDAVLAITLKNLVDNFEYQKILTLLQEAREQESQN